MTEATTGGGQRGHGAAATVAAGLGSAHPTKNTIDTSQCERTVHRRTGGRSVTARAVEFVQCRGVASDASRAPMTDRTLEIDGSKDFGNCGCCGNTSRTVWGYVSRGDVGEAAYFVQWTVGAVDQHGASFDLIVGKWGGAPASERCGVSVAFRRMPTGPGFMIIDAETRPIAQNENVGTCLRRDEVVGTPLAKQVFDILDTICIQDPRIAELLTS